ncbi:MAG TPA: cytochrome c-type biogenesis protein CcmH [Rhabdaerophilum sp.]|nr:cytochrome c-type biogenesis protein CcmH [Rhabdaerophilum sp.]
MRIILVSLAFLAWLGPAFAVKPEEQLTDPALEARAREISAGIRCLVCQNQSIDDSDASLAQDLRRLVRERVKAGDSDQGVRDFLVARYGEFVLLKPGFNARNLVLWGLPLAALLVGGLAALRLFGRRRSEENEEPTPAALSAEEQAELECLLQQDRTKPEGR